MTRAALTALLLLPGPSLAAWRFETVDDGRAYWQAEMRFDAAGRPHIAFGWDHLYHAVRDAGAWSIEVADPAAGVGGYASLALDAVGRPHIAHVRQDFTAVLYTTFDGSAWSTVVVDTADFPGSTGTGIALDSTGSPLIAYNCASLCGVRSARKNGASWTLESVISGTYERPSVAFAPGDLAHISVISPWGNPESVRLATSPGTGWTTETVDALRPTQQASSLAVSASGTRHVAFRDLVTGGLAVARNSGSGWSTEIVDAGADTGHGASIALDSLGRPGVAYVDHAASKVRFARHDGSAWSSEDVSLAGEAAGYSSTSLGFDPAGRPAIAWVNNGEKQLMFSTHDGMRWTTELVDRGRNAGSDTSLALDPAGRPVVTYHVIRSGSDAWWARRQGAAWVKERVDPLRTVSVRDVAVTAAGEVLAVVHAAPNYSLELGRFDGTAWTFEPVLPEQTPRDVLALDSQGRPVILFETMSSTQMQLMAFDGTSWRRDWIPTPAFPVRPEGIDLTIDRSDRPIVTFCGRRGWPTWELNLLRWDGTAWQWDLVASLPATSCEASKVRIDASGNPYVLFIEGSGASLTVRVMRKVGAAWQGDSLGSVGPRSRNASLELGPDGLPRVAFFDEPAALLRHFRFDGSTWSGEVVGSYASVNPPVAMAVNAAGETGLAFRDGHECSLEVAWQGVPREILRGPSVPALLPVSTATLPWRDPEAVLGPGYPDLLVYQVTGLPRIAVLKAGLNVDLVGY